MAIFFIRLIILVMFGLALLVPLHLATFDAIRYTEIAVCALAYALSYFLRRTEQRSRRAKLLVFQKRLP